MPAQVGERERQLCRARLAAYKVPVRWLFTSPFPLTATGKVRKDVLSAQLTEANGRQCGRWSRDAMH